MNFVDNLIIKLMKWRIKRGWGGDCEVKDIDEFPDLDTESRCGSCRAREVFDWLEYWEGLNRWK